MSKRTVHRLAMSICFILCVMTCGHITVFADEVKPVHEYNFDSDKDGIVYDSIKEGAMNSSIKSDNFIPGYNGEGKARHFDKDNKESIGFPGSVIPRGDKSIRFKFRKEASSLTTTTYDIIMSTHAYNSRPFYISIVGNNSSIEAGCITININGSGGLKSPTSICDGTWHDILFIWSESSNSMKLYVDDMTAPVDTFTFKTRIDFAASGFFIGGCYDWSYGTELFTGDLDNIQIYNKAIIPETSIPVISSNLEALGGDSKIDLTWDAVDKATSYTVKRSTTAGGPYETISTDVAGTTCTDTNVTNGTTYYYIVTAIVDGRESGNTNEASAIPEASQTPPTTEAKLKVVLEVAESLQLSVDDDLNVNTQMSWSSSEPTVATVNEKGIVTALAPGNTVITVKSADGSYTDSINVLVVENADDYRLAIDLKVGETARLTADDFTNTANITWAPMDSSIANVTTKGKVTALSKGLVLISAKDADGNIIGRVYVRVRE